MAQAGQVTCKALGKGITFHLPPVEHDTESTSPMAAKLFVSSANRDADLFLIVRVFDPQDKELTFMGCTDPNTPIANGRLRMPHCALDPVKSKPYRPWHPHDKAEPLTPGHVYECDTAIVTSCIVVPKGCVALTTKDCDLDMKVNSPNSPRSSTSAHEALAA